MSIKNILNVILTFLVFFVTTKYFPEIATVNNTKTLFIVVFFYYLILVGIGLLILGITSLLVILLYSTTTDKYSEDVIGCFCVWLFVFALLIITPMTLNILNRCIDGFTMGTGFTPYMILTVLLFVFNIPKKEKNKENTEEKS